MTAFLVLAALLAALAIAVVAWPLLRPRADDEGRPVAPSRAAAGVVAVAVPLAAFALYFTWSDWSWNGTPADHATNPAASMGQMAEQLEARLMREGGDADGWKLLGRTYVVAGNYPKAAEAYRQAYTLTSGADLDAMLGYAEARVLVNESDFEGEAGQLFEQAVAAQSTDPRALWYSGVAAYRRHDLATARDRWAALREQGAPQEIIEVINSRIAEIDKSLGTGLPGPATPAARPPAAAAVAAAPPSAAQPVAEPPAGVTEAAAASGIPLRVAVAPALAGRVPPGATVFVFANSGAGGPPLAAVRRQGAQLPLDITLSDSDAMIDGTSLTQADSLRLVARVSMTGRPIASAGDLFGEVRYDPRSKGRVTLTIDRVVE